MNAAAKLGLGKAVRKHPERTFHSWVDRLIDRIVLPPMFTTLIGHEHTDMASIGRRMALIGRGLKTGLPDVFVAQHHAAWKPVAIWLELKRGTKVSDRQELTHRQMRWAGQRVSVAETMQEVVAILRMVGFSLHENADRLAAEYERRVLASEAAPAIPRKPRKPKAPRATQAKVAAYRRAGVLV